VGRRGTGVELRDSSIRLSFVYNGERVRETLRLEPTPRNAQYAAKLVATINQRIKFGTFNYEEFFPDSPRAPKTERNQTFGQMCDVWLETKGRLATRTRTQYANGLKVWKRLLGRRYAHRQDNPRHCSSRGGQHTMGICEANKQLPRQPARRVRAGRPRNENRVQQVLPDPLSLDEMELVLQDLREHYDLRIWAYFEFAFMTGMRPEEIIALKWDDLDDASGTIRVARARSAGEIKALKTYMVRNVDLGERAQRALAVMRPHTLDSENRFIFQNPVTGRPFHDERSQRDHYWTPALRRQGIRHRRAYNTRHTYATNALLAGANPSYVSRQMGHRSAKMLFEVYSKWIDGADRGRERAKIEAALRTARASE
jgi:integrase